MDKRFETEEEEELFNQMDKFDIYLSYLAEHNERQRLAKDNNRLYEIMARIRMMLG